MSLAAWAAEILILPSRTAKRCHCPCYLRGGVSRVQVFLASGGIARGEMSKSSPPFGYCLQPYGLLSLPSEARPYFLNKADRRRRSF